MFIKVILVLIVVGGAAFFVRRFLRAHKRSLSLVIENPTVAAGMPLQCKVILENQSMIRCNEITLTLVGTKEVRDNRGEGARTVTKEVHRSRHIVVGTKTYPPKHKAEYEIAVPTPAQGSSSRADAFDASLAADIKASAKRANQTKWQIEARLDGVGVKLSDVQAVSIGDGGSNGTA